MSDIITTILEKGDLFWNVEKQPLTLPNGTPTDFFGTVRTDTDHMFTSVKDGYEVFQNWELAELVTKLADERGFTIGDCGSFKDGAKVYVQLDMENMEINGTELGRHITAINSHDASHGLKFGHGNIDMWCENTYQAVSKELGRSIRHTRSLKAMVEDSLNVVEQIVAEEKTLLEKFIRMANKKTDIFSPTVQKVVEVATGVDITMSPEEAQTEYSTRRLNTASDLISSIEMEMGRRDATLWSLFSGYTHYSTHKAGTDKSRAESKMSGSLQKKDNEILELLNVLA